ncbi:hypothetical protein L228DRAFT_248324 [Xylona heveae TC161]|uniref:Uncharacterized protein n=1 Tax=Xylona heveae (strain CBS 132557 / TC161) TaxID=1328760 RepID=A0A165G0P6_XYLHT|nr:hypothetical protein L228DRAFT_248324 [Xylona heveae TC161]KZF21601.1 hypothetical protein L228DRAFT_248324 [Xylona heveae TC161]
MENPVLRLATKRHDMNLDSNRTGNGAIIWPPGLPSEDIPFNDNEVNEYLYSCLEELTKKYLG